MILWQTDNRAPIVARVAVAGDFLPGWKPCVPRPNLFAPGRWREMAHGLTPIFDDVALSFINCECTLDAAGLAPRPVDGLGENISAAPDCLDYLSVIRAGIVGIANNHICDFGAPGVERTRSAIVARGLIPLGAGHTLAAPPEVFVWQGPSQIRIGFWAAALATRNPSRVAAAGVEPASLQRGREALQFMNEQHARFRIALLHAGHERASYPAPEDVRAMDALADCGFDIVAASHSHRISGARLVSRENHRPAFCFYGLGSIVSGYASSSLDREGLVVVAGFGPRGELARLEVRSVLLDENGFGAVPRADADPVLNRFRILSAHIAGGSYVRLFYREISPGLMSLYFRDSRRAFEQSGVRGLARKARRIRLRHIRRLMHSVLQ